MLAGELHRPVEPLRVTSIDALIQMKRAAGRQKDLVEVEILGAVRDELDRNP